MSVAPDAIAPDGSEVRVLCQLDRGGLAQFTLPPGAIAKAVAHRTVDEMWCFTAGTGHRWLRSGDAEEVVAVRPGTSISIPVGTRFQFRADPTEALVAIGVTMPRWPAEGDAYFVEGKWPPTV